MKRTSNDTFYFVLKAENGEVLLRGELYATKAEAISGIDAVKINASIDTSYQTNKESGNDYIFILTDDKGNIIGISEPHTTLQSLERAKKAVKADAPYSVFIDQA